MQPKTRITIVALLFGLAAPVAMSQTPSPVSVPGKEYSDNVDVDQGQINDPLQNLYWDGLGGNTDAFDYSNSGPPPQDPDQVDALAHHEDYLFGSLLNNQAQMIVSLDQENYLRNHNVDGSVGIWATAAQIRSPAPPTEVDAVELWGGGPEAQSPGSGIDADHYSYIGDAILPVPPGGGFPAVSIFYYNGVASTPYIYHNQLLNQLNASLELQLTEIDVDALMVLDLTQVGVWETGDKIIFSLRPTGTLDGGELFVWEDGQPITYLVQGGRVWDTINPVAAIFSANTENIDALEAVTIVPEPGGFSLLLLSGAGVFLWSRRSRWRWRNRS